MKKIRNFNLSYVSRDAAQYDARLLDENDVVAARYRRYDGYENNPNICALPEEEDMQGLYRSHAVPLPGYDSRLVPQMGTEERHRILFGIKDVRLPLPFHASVESTLHNCLIRSYANREYRLAETGKTAEIVLDGHTVSTAMCSRRNDLMSTPPAFSVIGTAGSGKTSAIRLTLRTMRSKGYNQKHILLVGYSRAAEAFIDRVANNPEWGYQVRGILDENREWGTEYRGVKVIGTPRDLKDILELNTLDEIAITLSLNEYKNLEEIVAACEKSGVHTKFIPDYNNIIPTIPQMEDLQGLPIINIRRVPLTNMFNATIKRIVDIFGALVAIVIFSPLMLATVALIKLTSPGPIIFSQERVGLHNRPFKMYKFRSMEVQNPSSEKSKWTTPNDPRVTSVGRFIRKTSIDEMPQFFNILKGDMSLVGPRPERPFFVERFKEEIPRYMVKHQVRPGLTGWAQVNGYRGDTSITKRIEHDLYYIENWTLGFDFKILFLTIFKGFINKNAY